MPGQSADAGREAGSWQQDAVEQLPELVSAYGADGGGNPYSQWAGNVSTREGWNNTDWLLLEVVSPGRLPKVYTSEQRQAAETRAVNVAIPSCIYLGLTV